VARLGNRGCSATMVARYSAANVRAAQIYLSAARRASAPTGAAHRLDGGEAWPQEASAHRTGSS
jgi:hypothetical protein